MLHALGLAAVIWALAPARERETDLVDIELAPPPPKAEALPAEQAKPPEAPPAHEEQPAATQPPAEEHGEQAVADAGIDAPVDAPRRQKRPDAAIDAEVPMVAESEDAGEAGEGSGTGSGSGSGSGVAAAVAEGSGSGVPGMTDEPAVEGAPTTAGTAADLLAYFPPGHVVTALVRFDRLRNTEWARPTELLLRPLPDYRGMFGDRDASIAQKLDTLVISSPRPRDATATTLVAHAAVSRAELRDLLANPDVSITWSTARGGMLGRRTGKLFPNDKRVVLAPWKGWFVLAQPEDLGPLVAPAGGDLDKVEARGKMPPWLDTIRTIEKESGDDQRGPALVVTCFGGKGRYKVPDVGLGVTSLPAPQRISLAMELVKQGWLVRGNISFTNEADAAELVAAVEAAQQRIIDSHLLSMALRRQHLLDFVKGLSLARTGARVSYGTSLSIADARTLLAEAAVVLDQYFRRP